MQMLFSFLFLFLCFSSSTCFPGTNGRVSAGDCTTPTSLHVKRVASMPPGLDVSSPQLADKHRGYTDLRPICDVRFCGPSDGDGTTGCPGTISPGTARDTPSMGLMGRIPASDPLHLETDRIWRTATKVACWRCPREIHEPLNVTHEATGHTTQPGTPVWVACNHEQDYRTCNPTPDPTAYVWCVRGVCVRFGALCLPRCRVFVCLSGLPRLECLLPVLLARVPAGPLSNHSSVQHDVHPSVIPFVVRAARARLLVCLRMFTQHAARLSRSDILPWATPFWFFLFSEWLFHECPLQHSRSSDAFNLGGSRWCLASLTPGLSAVYVWTRRDRCVCSAVCGNVCPGSRSRATTALRDGGAPCYTAAGHVALSTFAISFDFCFFFWWTGISLRPFFSVSFFLIFSIFLFCDLLLTVTLIENGNIFETRLDFWAHWQQTPQDSTITGRQQTCGRDHNDNGLIQEDQWMFGMMLTLNYSFRRACGRVCAALACGGCRPALLARVAWRGS